MRALQIIHIASFNFLLSIRGVGEAAVVQADKLKSWPRWTECKLAWFRGGQ
jgi:hypothetical protein